MHHVICMLLLSTYVASQLIYKANNETTYESEAISMIFGSDLRFESINRENTEAVWWLNGNKTSRLVIANRFPSKRNQYLDWIKKDGALGVVEISTPGRFFFEWSFGDPREAIPVVIVENGFSDFVREEPTFSTFITVYSQDSTHRNYLNSPWPKIFTAVQVFVNGLCIVYFIWRGRHFFGTKATLAKAAVIFETIAAFLRMIGFLFTDVLAYVIPTPLSRFLLTIGIPLSLVTNFMIILFWHESLLNKSLHVPRFLDRFQPAFWALSTVLILLDIIGSVLAGLTYLPLINLITTASYVIVMLVMIVYCTYTSIILLRRAKMLEDSTVARRIVRRMGTTVALMLALILVSIPLAFIQGYVAGRFFLSLVFLILAALGIVIISSFHVPKLRSSTAVTGSKSGGSSGKTNEMSVVPGHGSIMTNMESDNDVPVLLTLAYCSISAYFSGFS